MFGKNFYANRSILDNEFIQANFYPSTGLSPEEIDRQLNALFDQQVGNTSTAILRAEMFAFLYDNVQIEINEKNLFAAKINHQKVFCKYTNLFKNIFFLIIRPKPWICSRRQLNGDAGRALTITTPSPTGTTSIVLVFRVCLTEPKSARQSCCRILLPHRSKKISSSR